MLISHATPTLTCMLPHTSIIQKLTRKQKNVVEGKKIEKAIADHIITAAGPLSREQARCVSLNKSNRSPTDITPCSTVDKLSSTQMSKHKVNPKPKPKITKKKQSAFEDGWEDNDGKAGRS